MLKDVGVSFVVIFSSSSGVWSNISLDDVFLNFFKISYLGFCRLIPTKESDLWVGVVRLFFSFMGNILFALYCL